MEHVPSLLRGVKDIRQRYGIPHRIVLDEAHYLLHDPKSLETLDLELGEYTLVTYQPSRLHSDLLRAIEAMVVTRLTDQRELSALAPSCAQPDECRSQVSQLPIGSAAILPLTQESGGVLSVFRLAPRFTSHVRDRESTWMCPSPRRANSCLRNMARQRARVLARFGSSWP